MAMPTQKSKTQLFPLLKSAITAYFTNPVILFPFVTIGFIQLLVLEILYFAPRYPLNIFFNPIIGKLWGEIFLHYPHHLILLPKLFQIVQIPLYIFVSSFLICMAIVIIAAVNNNQKIHLRTAFRTTLTQYVHIVVCALIAFGTFYGLYSLYELLMTRASQIRSESGIYFIIKTIIIQGAPYFNLLIGALITTLFAFVFPIMMIERKKVFAAILLNFRHLWKSWWFVFFVVLIPTLLYVPVLLLRNNVPVIAQAGLADIRLFVICLSVVVIVLIDATIYTALTTFYLLKKENR